jgi:hypothetical protein
MEQQAAGDGWPRDDEDNAGDSKQDLWLMP